MEAATTLDTPSTWNILANEALRQGNHEMVEMAYQRMHAFDKLSFLYVLTGNTQKLEKMMKIASLRQDIMAMFQNALFLGDAPARVHILEQVGQTTLAYLTAATYGLGEEADRLRVLLEEQAMAIPEVNQKSATLLVPPICVSTAPNWPLLELPRSQFDKMMEEIEKEEVQHDEHGYEENKYDETMDRKATMSSREGDGQDRKGTAPRKHRTLDEVFEEAEREEAMRLEQWNQPKGMMVNDDDDSQ